MSNQSEILQKKQALIEKINRKIAEKKARDPNWVPPPAIKKFQAFGDSEDDTSALQLMARAANIPGGIAKTGVAGVAQMVGEPLYQQMGKDFPDIYQEGDFLKAIKGESPGASTLMKRAGAPEGLATEAIGLGLDIVSDIPASKALKLGQGMYSAGKGLYRFGLKPLDEAASKYKRVDPSGSGSFLSNLFKQSEKQYPISDQFLTEGQVPWNSKQQAESLKRLVNKRQEQIDELLSNEQAKPDIALALKPAEESIEKARNIDPRTGVSLIPKGVEKSLDKIQNDINYLKLIGHPFGETDDVLKLKLKTDIPQATTETLPAVVDNLPIKYQGPRIKDLDLEKTIPGKENTHPTAKQFNNLKKILGSVISKKSFERLGTDTSRGIQKSMAGGVRDEAIRALDAASPETFPGQGQMLKERLGQQGDLLNAFKQAEIEIGKTSRKRPITAVDAMLAGAHADAPLIAKKLLESVYNKATPIGYGVMRSSQEPFVPSAFLQLLTEQARPEY